jgi:acetamidase/formamidase
LYWDTPSGNTFLAGSSSNGGSIGVDANPAGASPVYAFSRSNYTIVSGQPIFPTALASGGTNLFGLFSVNQNFTPGDTMNFDCNVEKSLGGNAMLQVGYVGSQGRHLATLLDINQPALGSSFTSGKNAAGFTALPASRPFYSMFPNFAAINQLHNGGTSNYNSLPVVVKTRSWHGLIAQYSLTWAHYLDEESSAALPQDSTNLKGDYGNATNDIRTQFNGYFIYDIARLNHGPKWLFRGWQANSNLYLRTGKPVLIKAAADNSGTQEASQRANIVGDPFAGLTHTFVTGQSLRWFTPSAFVNPRVGTFAAMQRDSVFGPGFASMDLSLFRTFAIKERMRLQFRAEAFHGFNHVNMAQPSAKVGSSLGLIGSTIGASSGQPGIGPGEPFNMAVGGEGVVLTRQESGVRMRGFTVVRIAAFAAWVAAADAASLAGEWMAEISSASEPQYVRVVLREEGGKISGTWGDESKVDGGRGSGGISLRLTGKNGEAAGTLVGQPSGEDFSGDGSLQLPRRMGPAGRDLQKVFWKLSRIPERAGSPKTWEFDPKVFYSYYSAKNPPALRIFPGDTVHTWTVDAGGLSPKMERQSRGGDATTGPFYVEGALPGDTLVVKLDRVRTNRATARQGSRINAHAVTTAYAAAADYSSNPDGEWLLDADRKIARLSHPTERLKNLTVPILPMLGCLAVAPPGEEVYRGTDLGNFGGNMDYNQNVEGTTLYFPVFHPGGLFVLGDGHAAMGDGEVTGSALETSMDVTFTVALVKGYATAAPRAETSEYLISFGIAGSVPEAIQNATSQLASWLKRAYRLNDSEVAVLLGAVMKYDITELVDPKYNVVAKVPKSTLKVLQ